MAETVVKVEPYKRGDDFTVAGFRDERGFNITDRDYHAVRDKIMEMRQRDPGAAKLYDKFIDEVVHKRGSLPQPEMEMLNKGLSKNGLGLGSLTNSIAADLKAHNYSASYRPEVMLSVNGRPMIPSILAGHLQSANVVGEFNVQRSAAPGKVSGTPMNFSLSEAAKMVPEPATSRYSTESVNSATKTIREELVTHSRWKAASKGLFGVGIAAAAGLAAAAEPGATPLKVADAVVSTAVPGWQEARKGQACKMFGEVAGYAAAGVTIGAGTTVTVTAAIGLGAATGPAAPVTAAAVAAGGAYMTTKAAESAHQLASSGTEAACNVAASGINKIKTSLGFGS